MSPILPDRFTIFQLPALKVVPHGVQNPPGWLRSLGIIDRGQVQYSFTDNNFQVRHMETMSLRGRGQNTSNRSLRPLFHPHSPSHRPFKCATMDYSAHRVPCVAMSSGLDSVSENDGPKSHDEDI